MFKDAIDYLLGLFLPPKPTHDVGAFTYRLKADKTLGDMVLPPDADALKLSTLTGFCDTYKARIDDFPEKVAVHIEDFDSVALVSLAADTYGRRHVWMRAKLNEMVAFPFNEYLQPEKFIICLQSGFLPTEEVIQVQKLLSSLSTENSVQTADDGLTQVVTVKQGTVTRTTCEIPPRLKLAAFRTFREVTPAITEFMLRLKGGVGVLPTAALIDISAGKWKLDTMQAVKHWLQKQLPEATIIA